MVTKRKRTSETAATKGKVKVGKLNLNKETVKDLANAESKKVKGGAIARASGGGGCTNSCNNQWTCNCG